MRPDVRPPELIPAPSDSDYQRGFKDGIWLQRLWLRAVTENLRVENCEHVFPTQRADEPVRCMRCAKEKT